MITARTGAAGRRRLPVGLEKRRAATDAMLTGGTWQAATGGGGAIDALAELLPAQHDV